MHVRSGPRFETAEQCGISHFLEHMLHRGVPRHPSAHAQALAFEELGSELSAATYSDHSVLAATAPEETAHAVVALLGEVCRAPLFGQIDIERRIVREEILESLNEEGDVVDPDEILVDLAFPDHGLGRPITGPLEALERFDRAMLEAAHRSHYTASGVIVSVAGAVDRERIAQEIAAAFDGLPTGEPPSAGPPPPPPRTPRFRFVKDTTSQTAVRVGFRAPGGGDPLEPATELLLRVLDDGMSARLYHRICDELGLAYNVSAAYETFSDAGLLSLASECTHERAPELLRELLEIARGLATSGPTERELEKVKRRVAWQLRAAARDPAELAAYLGYAELTGSARTPRARGEELAAVKREAVTQAAQALFTRDGLVVAAVGQLRARDQRGMEREVERF